MAKPEKTKDLEGFPLTWKAVDFPLDVVNKPKDAPLTGLLHRRRLNNRFDMLEGVGMMFLAFFSTFRANICTSNNI